jgi:hypothetical protein
MSESRAEIYLPDKKGKKLPSTLKVDETWCSGIRFVNMREKPTESCVPVLISFSYESKPSDCLFLESLLLKKTNPICLSHL